MLFMVAGLSLALVMGSAADVKGKRPDGTTSEDTALLILDQKDSTITGTIGGSETDQHPITSGKIEGTKVTLAAKNTRNGRELSLELTIEEDQMKGTVTMGERQGQIVVKKRKE
jgi:predicted dehydrogenase